MKSNSKCEICGNSLDEKNRESVTYQKTTTYVCNKCMHRIISLMTVMKGYKDMAAKGIKINLEDEVKQLSKIIQKEVR